MVIRVIVTVVASLLPTVSVVIQYFIHDDLVKLYLIVLASAIFALALAVMTNARMVEVFAATSAYVIPTCDVISLLTLFLDFTFVGICAGGVVMEDAKRLAGRKAA